jgi:hypothetical protein
LTGFQICDIFDLWVIIGGILTIAFEFLRFLAGLNFLTGFAFMLKFAFFLFSFKLLKLVPNPTKFSSSSLSYGLVGGFMSSGKLIPDPEKT